MSYLNPLLAFGMAQLPRRPPRAGRALAGLHRAGILPFEESGELHQALEAEGLALVQMVTRR